MSVVTLLYKKKKKMFFVNIMMPFYFIKIKKLWLVYEIKYSVFWSNNTLRVFVGKSAFIINTF